MRYKHWIGVGASILLGLVFIIAGLGKSLHPVADAKISYDLKILLTFFPYLFTPTTVDVIFTYLPRLEILIGLLLVLGIAAKTISIITMVLISIFMASNYWLLSQGLGYESCGCFGFIAESYLTVNVSFGIDIAMLTLAFIVLFCYQSNFTNVIPWFCRRGKTE
ncbi:MauE/DoxX family redox-associated membrane protein [Chloroflexota bacterium]